MMVEDQAMHRKLAADLFNHTWELMDKPDRSLEETDEMIHAAHASVYHWGIAGTALNLARGEWQVSRAYTVVGRGEPARFHAQRCLDLCLEHGFVDWDLAFAYEALARACRVAGDSRAFEQYRAQAREAGDKIAEKEDREVFDKDYATL